MEFSQATFQYCIFKLCNLALDSVPGINMRELSRLAPIPGNDDGSWDLLAGVRDDRTRIGAASFAWPFTNLDTPGDKMRQDETGSLSVSLRCSLIHQAAGAGATIGILSLSQGGAKCP